MVKKTIVVALVVLLVAAVATFVGVFFGMERKTPGEEVHLKAAVAADAGPCSEIGRWALASLPDLYMHANVLNKQRRFDAASIWSHAHAHKQNNRHLIYASLEQGVQ